eukprot:766514-Pleurochrysis_carterae.AAC.4
MLRRTSMLFRPMVRGLSTAAALPEKPPVPLFGIAGRYTNALYCAAAKNGDLLKVESDLGALAGILQTSKAIKAFTMDPGVSRSEKAKLLVGSLGDAGACNTTKNMVAVLCESGRMKELPTVMKMYATLMSAAKGEVSALITSSHELEEAQMESIRSQIAEISVFACGRRLRELSDGGRNSLI